jgi:hypothetical protein
MMHRLLVELECREWPICSALARRWVWTIPAIAAAARAASHLRLRWLQWQLAAVTWEVWDSVQIEESSDAWMVLIRWIPWSGGFDNAIRMASGQPPFDSNHHYAFDE